MAENNKLKHITRKKLATEFDISDVTINKTYKKIEIYKNIIFDKKRTDKISKTIANSDNDDDEIPFAILEKMKHFNIVAMVNGSGATSFVHIHEQLEKMTIEKIGRLITLGDLYNTYGKEFYCITHNMTSNKMEILSHKTYPDMPCLIALRMTANLPFVFDHFKYLGSFYVDGGLSNNFPIDIGDKIGQKILGITIYNTNSSFIENTENMLEYIYQLMFIPIKQRVSNNIESASDKCTIVTLQPDKTPFFNFNLDTHSKLEMFSDGFVQMRTFWEN